MSDKYGLPRETDLFNYCRFAPRERCPDLEDDCERCRYYVQAQA